MSTLTKLSIGTPPVVTPRILETDGAGEAAIALIDARAGRFVTVTR